MSKQLEDRDYVLLSAYIDSELAANECHELEDRIGKCPAIARQFNIMAGQSVLLRNQSERLLADQVYPQLSQDIEDILGHKMTPAKHIFAKTDVDVRPRNFANNNTPIWTGIAAAAAVLLAFVGGNWFNETARDVAVGTLASNDAQMFSYSPVNNPLLDEQISMTLEETLSGDIRQVSLGASENSGGTIKIEPLRTFRQGTLFCREYHVTFPIDRIESGPDEFFGRACRTDDGQWKTVYRLIPGADLPDLGSSEGTLPKQTL